MSTCGLSVRLEQALVSRDIESGLGLLHANYESVSQLSASSKDAGVLLGCIAKWIDMDFALLEPVDQILSARFPKVCRSTLPFRDIAYIRFADGVVAMHRGRLKYALHELTTALSDAADLGDNDLQISTSYFAARCFRMEGRYGEAAHYANGAENLSCGGTENRERQVAVIKTLKAWLLFQKGDHVLAKELLEWAKSKLDESSDYVSKGNAWSLQARMERRLGRAHLEHFNRAIQEYEKGGEPGKKHPNLARVLANRALSNIILAHHRAALLKEKLTEPSLDGQKKSDDINEQRRMIDRLHEKAGHDLSRAEEICRPLQIHRVLASCCLRRAFMYLEQSNGDKARQKVAEAYKLASTHDDYIMMGRAKVLECMIEDQDYLEGVGPDPIEHAHSAHDCASEAVDLAERTENRGLRARAHLAMGFTLLNLQNDRQKAAEHLKNAETIYNSGSLDFLWEDLQSLRGRIVNRGTISTELSAWIQRPEGKSSNDLENLLYGLVWEHVGHKIGRVAENLGVDPETAKTHLARAGCLPRRRASPIKTKPAA